MLNVQTCPQNHTMTKKFPKYLATGPVRTQQDTVRPNFNWNCNAVRKYLRVRWFLGRKGPFFKENWLRGQDLNLWPSGYEPDGEVNIQWFEIHRYVLGLGLDGLRLQLILRVLIRCFIRLHPAFKNEGNLVSNLTFVPDFCFGLSHDNTPSWIIPCLVSGKCHWCQGVFGTLQAHSSGMYLRGRLARPWPGQILHVPVQGNSCPILQGGLACFREDFVCARNIFSSRSELQIKRRRTRIPFYERTYRCRNRIRGRDFSLLHAAAGSCDRILVSIADEAKIPGIKTTRRHPPKVG